MKFHYAKYLVGTFLIAFLTWTLFYTLAIDPLTLARSQNRQLGESLSEARGMIEKNSSVPEGATPLWLRGVDQNLAAALVLVDDQKKSLDQVADKRAGFDMASIQTLLASVVLVVGTFSTVILSWRKDMREAQAELEKLKTEKPKIVAP